LKVKPPAGGQPPSSATVTSRTLGDEAKLNGAVVEVGGMIMKNRIYDADPTADVDRRVFEIKIRLDEESSKRVANLIHHQVRVEIHTGGTPAP
jgi:HlyD family secretion protein